MIAPDPGNLGYAYPAERLAYDPYGRLMGSAHSAYASHQWWRDYNCDGTFGDTTDPGDDLGMLVNAANTPSAIGDTAYKASMDLDRNGSVEFADLLDHLGMPRPVDALPDGWLSTSDGTSYPVDPPDNAVGYAGYLYNQETESWHVRHRVYRPDLGRWMTRDPSGYIDGANTVEYVTNSPANSLDPTGRWTIKVIINSSLVGWAFERRLIENAQARARVIVSRAQTELREVRQEMTPAELTSMNVYGTGFTMEAEIEDLEKSFRVWQQNAGSTRDLYFLEASQLQIDAVEPGTWAWVPPPWTSWPHRRVFYNRSLYLLSRLEFRAKVTLHELMHHVEHDLGLPDMDGTLRFIDPVELQKMDSLNPICQTAFFKQAIKSAKDPALCKDACERLGL